MPKLIKKKPHLAEDNAKLLDRIGWKILRELQSDGRLPFAELGRRVGLSTPATMERVHRLQEAGIITGFRAEVDHKKVGYPIVAFVRVNVVGNFLPHVIKVSREMPEVLECYRVTGADSFIIRVAVRSVDDLQSVIDRFTPFVATTTSVVLSAIVTSRIIQPE
jgi:Lrp/AsnC family transcriptional regulator, leucine-responsive regulatory protein